MRCFSCLGGLLVPLNPLTSHFLVIFLSLTPKFCDLSTNFLAFGSRCCINFIVFNLISMNIDVMSNAEKGSMSMRGVQLLIPRQAKKESKHAKGSDGNHSSFGQRS